MAIRKIMDQKSKDRHTCIRCGKGRLPRLVEGRKVKCKTCGCILDVHFTENGNIVLTDQKYSKLFKQEEKE